MVKEYVGKNTCDARFGDVKSNIVEIKDNIKCIKDNHLFHIEKDITIIKTWGTMLAIIPTVLSTILMIMEFLR